MRRTKKQRQRKVLDYSDGDKRAVYSYQRKEAPTKMEIELLEFLTGRNYVRELNKEIISLCDKHFRYGG